MGYIEPMTIVDSGYDLLEIFQSLGRRQPALGAEVVEQFASFDVFEDEIQLCRCFPYVIEAHDVWVIDELHDDYLPFDPKEDTVSLFF